MEMSVVYDKGKCKADAEEEEESLLIERLIALKKQLEDDVPKIRPAPRPKFINVKENIISNKNIISKFRFRKSNNRIVNKFLSTKIDNRNITKNHTKNKPIKTVTSKKNLENVNDSENMIIKCNLELIELIENSQMKKSKFFKNYNILLKDNENSEISQLLHNVDQYVLCFQDYLTETDQLLEKHFLRKTETNNKGKNVHVNRKFQNQLISNNFLNPNFKISSNSLVPVKKLASAIKKKPLKRLSGKSTELPNLISIGTKKLLCQSFRTRWKIFNKQYSIDNSLTKRKPLSTLQCPTSNTLITSLNRKTKWTNVTTNPKPPVESKLSNSNITNKLKWTKPNMLLVNNVNNNNNRTSLTKSDKLILFGKNKIIRQSLIHSTQSKTNNYLLKHFSHRLALIRKLQQKNCILKAKSIATVNEQQNILSMKKTINKAVEVKKNNGKRSYSMYSYVNPTLRSTINIEGSVKKTESSNSKISRLLTISHNKSLQRLKVINNNSVNLTNNKTLRNKKTEQLCLVFNRFGKCSKLDQEKCDKRHYKKYITLCTKYLTGECSDEKCNLSHNIVEEKIPFCKHYLNSVCVQLNCPYLHEFRNTESPICKNFLHGYCTQGKKCPKKHLNLCPIFESKNKCPHGQKCLYPHVQCEEKIDVNVATNEPRYFEITIPDYGETNENDSIHIVPKRGAPLTDLPSFLPLK